MLVAVWPLVFAVVGVLVYVLASNAKAAEIGRLVFFSGFFWLVYTLAHATLELAK